MRAIENFFEWLAHQMYWFGQWFGAGTAATPQDLTMSWDEVEVRDGGNRPLPLSEPHAY